MFINYYYNIYMSLEKYLKYKNKYINLKMKINQKSGGCIVNSDLNKLEKSIRNRLKKINLIDAKKYLFNDIIKYTNNVDNEKINDEEYIKTLKYFTIIKSFVKGILVLREEMKKKINREYFENYDVISPGDSPTKIILMCKLLKILENFNFYSFPLSIKSNNSNELDKYIKSCLKPLIDVIKNKEQMFLNDINSLKSEFMLDDDQINEAKNSKKIAILETISLERSELELVNDWSDSDTAEVDPVRYYIEQEEELLKKYFGNLLYFDYIATGNTWYSILSVFSFSKEVKNYFNEQLDNDIYNFGDNSYKKIIATEIISSERDMILKNNQSSVIFTDKFKNMINLIFFFDNNCNDFIIDAEKYKSRCLKKMSNITNLEPENEVIDSLIFSNNDEEVSNINCEDFIIDSIIFLCIEKTKFSRRAQELLKINEI